MSDLSGDPVPRCIVVGVDGSEPAHRALRWAAAAASAFGGRLVVVHAVGLLEGAGYTGAFDLESTLAEVAGDVGDAVREPGPPDQALLRVAVREPADLVVVGHRGIGGSQQFLGSTSAARRQRQHPPWWSCRDHSDQAP